MAGAKAHSPEPFAGFLQLLAIQFPQASVHAPLVPRHVGRVHYQLMALVESSRRAVLGKSKSQFQRQKRNIPSR